MILILGCLLGLGLLLTVSPVLWPARAPRIRRRVASRMISRLRDRMTLAGLPRVGMPLFCAVSILVGAAATSLALALSGVAAFAVAVGLAALAIPALLVNVRARSRSRANRVLWPDVVDHLVSAVRSGASLPEGVAGLARSSPPSVRGAFGDFEHDYAATANFSRCLDRLKDRLADPVADRILETLRMSREVGGSELPAILRGLAAHLRQEAAIRGEAEARQSWVGNAAKLGAAAPWVILALLATRPEAAAAYNTPTGTILIVGGLLVTIVAYRMMLALARLPQERRWFR